MDKTCVVVIGVGVVLGVGITMIDTGDIVLLVGRGVDTCIVMVVAFVVFGLTVVVVVVAGIVVCVVDVVTVVDILGVLVYPISVGNLISLFLSPLPTGINPLLRRNAHLQEQWLGQSRLPQLSVHHFEVWNLFELTHFK